MNMFDPTSFTLIVILSLSMPVLSVPGFAVAFQLFKNFPAAGHKLARRKTKALLSLINGTLMGLLYLMIVMRLREYVPIITLSGIAVRVLIFAGLCSVGIYIGATVASRMFGPKVPPDSPARSP